MSSGILTHDDAAMKKLTHLSNTSKMLSPFTTANNVQHVSVKVPNNSWSFPNRVIPSNAYPTKKGKMPKKNCITLGIPVFSV